MSALTAADREALIASKYVSLEVAGCIDHPDHVEGLIPAHRAEYFTVYGRDAEGRATALVDLEPGRTAQDAIEFAWDLATPVGIRADFHPSMFPVITASPPCQMHATAPTLADIDWCVGPSATVLGLQRRTGPYVPDPELRRDIPFIGIACLAVAATGAIATVVFIVMAFAVGFAGMAPEVLP